MPNKIWIINADECLIAAYNDVAVLKESSLKYTLLLKPGDFCVISPWVENQVFLDYAARIKKLEHKNWLLQPAEHQPSEKLLDAILRDEVLVEKLRKLCSIGYVMVPYIYTKKFEKLSKLCKNKLRNNYKAIEQANNKLLFKQMCKLFHITTIAPVFEIDRNKAPRILSTLDARETYLLRRPVSAGGVGTIKGKLVDLLPLIKKYHKETDLYLERYKDIYRSIGTLVLLKDSGIYYGGVDCQIIHKETWEGCFFPFTKAPAKMLQRIREKALMIGSYYYGMGVRGQINIDWALRWKNGELKLRALECNPRYNGFSICQRVASTVYGLTRDEMHFYLDTKMQFPSSWDTKRVIKELDALNKQIKIRGGIVLTSGVEVGNAGILFIGTSRKEIADLRRLFKRHIKGLTPRKRPSAKTVKESVLP